MCLVLMICNSDAGANDNNRNIKAISMYNWIGNMTTCPKIDPNHYPKPSLEAQAIFKKALDADNARPKTLSQEEIVTLYQQAAKLGDYLAMHNLAFSYYIGDGVEEDEQQALYWFKEIEKLGVPTGYADMALVYRKGIGVAIDPIKSNEYMIKAAQAGNVDSQYYLGHDLYALQQENKKYLEYALKLWKCAAEQGHKDASFFLATHYESNDQLREAYRYYVLGAKAGSSNCLLSLSDAYGHLAQSPTFNLVKDDARAQCLYELNKKLRTNPDLTFPNLDELCPGSVPQPNEMK